MPEIFVADLADIDGIGKECVERASPERQSSRASAILVDPKLRANTFPIEVLFEAPDGTQFEIALIYKVYRSRLIRLHDQLVVLGLVAERRDATHPHALL